MRLTPVEHKLLEWLMENNDNPTWDNYPVRISYGDKSNVIISQPRVIEYFAKVSDYSIHTVKAAFLTLRHNHFLKGVRSPNSAIGSEKIAAWFILETDPVALVKIRSK
jgi:hypothetical protein